MFEDNQVPQKWWYVWNWLTRPAFRHCYAFAEVPRFDAFVTVRMGMGGTRMLWTHKDDLADMGYDHMWQYVADTTDDIIVPALGTIDNGFAMRWSPLTCVTLTKSLLGLKYCRAVTPWGLYKHLVSKCLDMLQYNEILVYRGGRGRSHVKSIQETQGQQLRPDRGSEEANCRGKQSRGRGKSPTKTGAGGNNLFKLLS